jgi:hypothetical protein
MNKFKMAKLTAKYDLANQRRLQRFFIRLERTNK